MASSKVAVNCSWDGTCSVRGRSHQTCTVYKSVSETDGACRHHGREVRVNSEVRWQCRSLLAREWGGMRSNSDMQVAIVGGVFGSGSRPSGVVRQLNGILGGQCENGTDIDSALTIASGGDLVLWMPDMDNGLGKKYPRKKTGAVLICSKVIREGYTIADAVSRIFKMQGNAVIAITKGIEGYCFRLVDALGNTWVTTEDLFTLCDAIRMFYRWSQGSVRVRAHEGIEGAEVGSRKDLVGLCEIVKGVSDKVVGSCYERYFGNASTRCMATFPSAREVLGAYVSKRNVDKRHLSPSDFVFAVGGAAGVRYMGLKPSVDTPIQLELYRKFPKIDYMIHGHAYVKGAEDTQEYFPCGDLRELHCVEVLLSRIGPVGVINLKHHGFLMFADTLDNLRLVAGAAEFENHYNMRWE